MRQMVSQLVSDGKRFTHDLMHQDMPFYFAAAYLTFEFLRPHTLYPVIDIIPWAQVTILLGLFIAFIKGQVRVQGMHLVLFLFLAVCYASSIYSYDTEASFKRINYIISWFVVVVFFTACVKDLKQYKLLTIILFLFLFKISFFGARTWAARGFSFTDWGIKGPQGYFENSGELSLLMVVFCAMSLCFILGHKPKQKIYYLVPLTAFMTVLASSSRGSQLAMLGAALLLLASTGKITFKNVALFMLMGFVTYLLLPEQQKERFTTMGEDATSESRLIYWDKGIEMMNDHKVLGVGYYAFPSYFHTYYAPYVDFENFRYRREVAHNSYIQVGSEMGYTGLGLYLWLLAYNFWLTSRTRRIIRRHTAKSNLADQKLAWVPIYSRGLDAAMVGYLIGSTFMSVAFYPYLYLFLMLNQTLYNGVSQQVRIAKRSATTNDFKVTATTTNTAM